MISDGDGAVIQMTAGFSDQRKSYFCFSHLIRIRSAVICAFLRCSHELHLPGPSREIKRGDNISVIPKCPHCSLTHNVFRIIGQRLLNRTLAKMGIVNPLVIRRQPGQIVSRWYGVGVHKIFNPGVNSSSGPVVH